MSNKIAILMGSESDRLTMEAGLPYLDYFKIDYEVHVMSAHRTPNLVSEFSTKAKESGYSVIIAGAGMAAHLAGAVKANTTLPVIGVPLPGGVMDGVDSLLSTVQMPKGVPVATVAVGKAGSINAAVLSAEIIALSDEAVHAKLIEFKSNGASI